MHRAVTTALAISALVAWSPATSASPKTTENKMTLNTGLKILEPMLGEWDCIETYHAGGFSPKDSTAHGTDVLRVGPGGNAIIADYVSNGDFGPYSAHDVITWDDGAKRFHYVFIDSFGPAIQLHQGRAKDATFVFEGPFSWNGKQGTMRRTYRDITTGATTLIVELVDDQGATTKLVTIKKTRKK